MFTIDLTKRKKSFVSILVFLSILYVLISVLLLYPNESDLDVQVKKLDKNFNGLGNFKLEAPICEENIEKYKLHELSTTIHVGIDFFAQSGVDKLPFLAMYDGIVTRTNPHIMYEQDGRDNFAYEMAISLNSKYLLLLNFETFGDTEEIKNLQKENIFVKVGDSVKKGDLLGNLIVGHEAAHVHFSLKRADVPDKDSWVVPEPYFSDKAVALIKCVFGYDAFAEHRIQYDY